MKTNWQIVSNRMKQLEKLHERMDKTKDLIYMEDFHLTTFDGKNYLDKVINVTGNSPVTFDNAIA